MREYKLAINGHDYTVAITSINDDEVVAEVNGETHVVAIKNIKNISMGPSLISLPEPVAPVSSVPLPARVAGNVGQAKAGMIVSPIPGHILEVCVTEGDKVLAGQKLLVLEAMKLENAITAETDGVVKKIMINAGDAVTHGQNMIEIG